LIVVTAVLLPPVYLVVRASEGGSEAWDIVFRSRTLHLLIDTALLAGTVTISTIAISLPLAWLTTRSDLPFRRAWVVLLALPLVFPSYVAAYALVAAIGPRGLVQDLLSPLGVETLPELYGFSGAWLILTLISYPYVFLPLRAGFHGIDRSIEEAARSLGSSPLATFFTVTLPNLRPSIAAGGILVALYALSDFGAVSILRFDSLTRVIYVRYKSSFDRSSAAALGLVLVALALAVVLAEGITRGRAAYHSRSRHKPSVVKLGGWRWPALAFCGTVVFVSVVVPLLIVGYWAVRGIESGESVWLQETRALNSLTASGLAALATLAAALPIAFLSARYPGRLSSLLEKATYCGFALPGIAIALSLVFFAANYATPLYQTLALLIFAYVIRFLPEALGASRSAMLQVNPNTEEAARGLGAGGMKVFFKVTAPQILPGMSAGALLVFLTAMKELPITLLLSPIGFETLATDIWSATTEAFFARAALPSLMLVALSAVAVFVMLRRERLDDE
jgi:iron(III) transport system permease protein